MDMLDFLEDAIDEMRVISITYTPGDRVIEPHALGRTRDGHYVLRAYQTSGATSSGKSEGWKLFRVDRIYDACGLDMNFEFPRPLYNPLDSAMRGGVIAHL